MKERFLLSILLLICVQINIFGQKELEKNFALSQFYRNEGNISIEHTNDGFNNGFENTFIQIHAPFYSSENQIFALQSKLEKKSLVGDQNLQVKLGLAWQFTFLENWNLIAGIKGTFSQVTINNTSKSTINNNADVLLQYQRFKRSGIMASFGVLQKYFWIISFYSQSFILNSQLKNYESASLDLTIGARYKVQNFDIKFLIQGFNLIHFNQNQLYTGFLAAYKGNYIYVSSNLLGAMSFELGLKPYSWLSIGLLYELNNLSGISNYGVLGVYHWKSQKLEL